MDTSWHLLGLSYFLVHSFTLSGVTILSATCGFSWGSFASFADFSVSSLVLWWAICCFFIYNGLVRFWMGLVGINAFYMAAGLGIVRLHTMEALCFHVRPNIGYGWAGLVR